MKEKSYLFLYECKHALVGIKRNFTLCLSAISAMTICVFFIIAFLIVGLHVKQFTNNLEGALTIHVVLNQNIEGKSLDSLEEKIEKLDNVEKVVLSDKDNELELMIQEKGEAFAEYRGEDNPLSNAFFVYVVDGNQIQDTSDQIQKLSGVSECSYGGSSATQLVDILTLVRRIGYVLAALLVLLSIYLISNAIRTLIYSRQQEISVMRTVGATDTFIRRPFEIQGILIGLMGSFLPALILWIGYPKLYDMMGGVLIAKKLSLIEPSLLISTIGVLILIVGALIGWLASFVSVLKHLQEQR